MQKSDSRENLFPFLQSAILTPSWLVPPALLTFKRHLPVTKAGILLTFCTYKVLPVSSIYIYIYIVTGSYMRKKPPVKPAGGTSQDGVLMATMRCASRHA